MITDNIITTILLGFTCGMSPGPIILFAFSEILRSPQDGLKNGGMYLIVATLTEFCIGMFLIITASWFQIPMIIFHIFTFLGVAILVYVAIQIYKIRRISYEKKSERKIRIHHIIILMLLNGPLWLFWISVCLPIAFHMDQLFLYGKYAFVAIFELSMIAGLGFIIFGFHRFRSYLSREVIVHRVFTILCCILIFIAGRMLYSEIVFFWQ